MQFMTRTLAMALRVSGICTLVGALGACAAPWHWMHRGAAPLQAVHVLQVEARAGAPVITVPEYWDRNTLRLDLTAAAGTGALRLRPRTGEPWPVRLEFQVQPGSVASLEVRGDERVIFNVPAQGAPVVLRLPVGVYAAKTPTIDLAWPAAGVAP